MQVHQDVTGGEEHFRRHARSGQRVWRSVRGQRSRPGEAAGKLPDVLSRLAQFQRTEIRLRATIRTLLAYPVLLAGVSSLVVLGLVTVVLPTFVGIFAQFDIPLPFITQVVVAASDMMRQYVWIWLPLVACLFVGLMVLATRRIGRRFGIASCSIRSAARDITRAFYIGRSFRLLGLMIESGVPLLGACGSPAMLFVTCSIASCSTIWKKPF